MEADQLQKRAAAGATPASVGRNPSTGPGGAELKQQDASAAAPSNNRRMGDRRSRPTTFWKSLRSPRRRAGGRRAGENENTYVDRYRKTDVMLLTAVFALNIADALLTLIWIQRGGSEANPLMDWFLQQGQAAFLAQKCLVVGLWLVILAVHKNFQIARLGLWFLLVLYGGILFYHIYLQANGMPVPPAGIFPGPRVPMSSAL